MPGQGTARLGFLDFMAAQLGAAWLARLAVMPDELTLRFADAAPLRVVHAAPGNPYRTITRVSSEAEARALLTGVAEGSVVAGHYHMAFERQLGDWQIINPGPVGTPHDGRLDASYAILEGTGPVGASNTGACRWTMRRCTRRCSVCNTSSASACAGTSSLSNFDTPDRCSCPSDAGCGNGIRQAEWTMELLNEFLNGGCLWRYLAPEYQFNRHLLDSTPIDLTTPDR